MLRTKKAEQRTEAVALAVAVVKAVVEHIVSAWNTSVKGQGPPWLTVQHLPRNHRKDWGHGQQRELA